MRNILAVLLSAPLCISLQGVAAEVKYQHPNLTIVAESEPLDLVLKSLGREMRIFITVPSGLNPVVSANVRDQPVKQAIKNLMGEMSYSLEWEEGGERLVGLTVFPAQAQSTAGASVPRNTQFGRSSPAAAPQAATAGVSAAAPVSGPSLPDPAADAERLADIEAAREEHEARMAEERAAHEAEMELRRQEEELAHEERMKEETARHEAESRAYVESQGFVLPD